MRVTIFSVLVLLMGSGLNLARAVWALADLPLSTSMPMTLLAGASVAWGLIFAICSFGLWRLRPWGRVGTLVAVTLYHVNTWFNHIVFDRSDYAQQVLPFSIANTVVVLLAVWGFLNWPSIRRRFNEMDRTASAGEDE
jgi:uncharacterized membrane protein (DUF2068 family)